MLAERFTVPVNLILFTDTIKLVCSSNFNSLNLNYSLNIKDKQLYERQTIFINAKANYLIGGLVTGGIGLGIQISVTGISSNQSFITPEITKIEFLSFPSGWSTTVFGTTYWTGSAVYNLSNTYTEIIRVYWSAKKGQTIVDSGYQDISYNTKMTQFVDSICVNN